MQDASRPSSSQDDISIGRSSSQDNLVSGVYERETRSTSAPRERRSLDGPAPVTAPPASSYSPASKQDKQQRSRQPIRTLLGRTSGRLIPLGPAWEASAIDLNLGFSPSLEDTQRQQEHQHQQNQSIPTLFQGQGLAVRVRCYCIGNQFDRSRLQDQIFRRSSASSVRAFPEVLTSVYKVPGGDTSRGDIFYFDWGCIVFWGLEKSAERHILREIAEPCVDDEHRFPPDRQERDQLRVLYTSSPKTVMENDTLALHYRFASDFDVKLAVSFALAQSTKLSTAEEELRRMGKRLAYVPDTLASTGEVPLTQKDCLRAVGHLYSQMSAVSLLGAALDVPDAMDSASSNIRELYKAVYQYLEVAERLNLLNDRFGVLREMLELCRTLGHHANYAVLEQVILWLICVCVALAVVQLIAFMGWKPTWRR